MADQYDDYRQPAPTGQQDPWSLGGGPEAYYARSSSLWGNATGGWEGKLALAAGGLPLALAVGGVGANNARKQQNDAENRRRMAVAEWRNAQSKRYGDLLGQQGEDVRADLAPEVEAALGAGGEMGDMGAIKNKMTMFQQRYQQYMLGRQKAAQSRQVDAQMSDPGRISGRNQRMQAQRTQGLGDIAESFRVGQRNNAFNQARRGMQGSSVDVEAQGGIKRGVNNQAQALQRGMDQQAQQYRLGDQQQRSQLMGLIHGGDPNTAAALAATMSGLQSQGQAAQENQAISAQRQQLNSATSTGISQALGGAMSSASKPLEYYLTHNGGGA